MKEWYDFGQAGQPIADSRAIVEGGKYRFTVLTGRMIRMEYCEDGIFEDRATQTVINRAFPLPDFRVVKNPGRLLIVTENLRLSYDYGPFSPSGLTIEVNGGITVYNSKWMYGQELRTLGGTARTLDEADGAIPLEDGILSADGFSLIDDGASMLIDKDGWVTPRKSNRKSNVTDLYFMGYGRDYLACLKDFFILTGPAPLLPRYALGNWWSRFHKYTDNEYIALMDRFRDEGIPISVGVIDIDWHPTQIDPKYGSGWTGYTWNKELFPDYKAFLKKLKEMNLRITLNLHPADGIRAYEAMYLEMAKELGVDYENEDKIDFDAADKKFFEACFRHIFHPYEEDGVDFWWIDWQQQGGTSVKGIDPLWMLNHLHYNDNCRDNRRGLTFSRYAGLGSHRYPVGFSGDTFATWESLDFQPYFTATASNAGYGWWSHDIGGHMHGYKDDEMALRWVQLGVFSPIMRLHSTLSPFNQKEPWMFGQAAEDGMKKFLRFRHMMAPYIYTMNKRFNEEGLPLVQPMYYSHPNDAEAYEARNEYWFGSGLIVCPITSPCDKVTGMGKFVAWLPEGTFVDIFNGCVYKGGRKLTLYRDLQSLPVLAKAGAVIPMASGENFGDIWDNPQELDILIAAGSGTFNMYEDNGLNEDGLVSAITEITVTEKEDSLSIDITEPMNGEGVIPGNRLYNLTVLGIKKPERVYGAESYCYDVKRKALSVTLKDKSVIINGYRPADNDIENEVFEMLHKAQYEYDMKSYIYDVVKRSLNKSSGKDVLIAELMAMNLDPNIFGALTEIITA